MKKILPHSMMVITAMLFLTVIMDSITGHSLSRYITQPFAAAEKKLASYCSSPRIYISDGIYQDKVEGFSAEKVYRNLQIIAGIYAGTIDIKVFREDGILKVTANGFYDEHEYPYAMQKAIKDANVNKDKVVTIKEVTDLQSMIYQEKVEFFKFKEMTDSIVTILKSSPKGEGFSPILLMGH